VSIVSKLAKIVVQSSLLLKIERFEATWTKKANFGRRYASLLRSANNEDRPGRPFPI
jgi:hypothetical protein